MTEPLQSLSDLDSLILPLLDAADVKTTIEVGTKYDGLSALLVERAKQQGSPHIGIDPQGTPKSSPPFDNTNGFVVRKSSLETLEALDARDAYFINNDPNYYTVSHELQLIDKAAKKAKRSFPLVFVHHTSWPWARRDQYTAPFALPDGIVKACTYEEGVVPGNSRVVAGGFQSPEGYAIALKEGGAKNGVLTAAEDFIKDRKDVVFYNIPSLFGLGILIDKKDQKKLEPLILPYHQSAILAKMAKAQWALYLDNVNKETQLAEQAAQMGAQDNTKVIDRLMNLIDQMTDNLDHPDIWASFNEEAKTDAGKKELLRLHATLEDLRFGQNDPGVIKSFETLMGIIHAIAIDLNQGVERLTRLETVYSQCPMVAGALFYANFLKDPNNPKYDLRDKVCIVPFKRMEVLDNTTHLCCASWLHTSAGNMKTTPWEEVWNSQNAQNIRQSILDGNYKYCNKMLCSTIQGNSIPNKSKIPALEPDLARFVENRQVALDVGPDEVNLSYDNTCNLSCPSCRSEKYAADNATRDAYSEMQEKSILPLLKHAKKAFITGSGDPFASKNFRDVMFKITDENYPNLQIMMMTNGLLLTRKEWEKFKHLHGKIARMRVSIDGASKESHEANRRGSNWEKMMENMKFMGELRDAGAFPIYHLTFIVQDNNFKEMGMAVDLAHEMHADNIYFSKISNWGTFTTEQFQKKLVYTPSHPQYAEFLEAISDPRLKDPIALIGDFADFSPGMPRRAAA